MSLLVFWILFIGVLALGMAGWVAFYFSARTIAALMKINRLQEDRHKLMCILGQQHLPRIRQLDLANQMMGAVIRNHVQSEPGSEAD